LNNHTYEEDRFLKPILEDDAVLTSLDEVLDFDAEPEGATTDGPDGELARTKRELAQLKLQFEEYRELASKTFQQRLRNANDDLEKEEEAATARQGKEHDENYFDSYAYNGIHAYLPT
jgi:protein arginine N-methyltransferase 3